MSRSPSRAHGGSRTTRGFLILLALLSLALLVASSDLPVPRYNMAWGEFSHQLAVDPGDHPGPTAGRSALLLALGGGAFIVVMALLARVGRRLGLPLALLLAGLLVLSAATLVLRPRLDGATPGTLLHLFAVRELGLTLLLISLAGLLGPLIPQSLAEFCRKSASRVTGARFAVATLALLVGAGIFLIDQTLLGGIPHAMDEVGQVFQAKIFASGRLWVDPPPLPELMGPFGLIDEAGKWRAMWLPGNALTMSITEALGLLPLYPALISALTVAALFWFVRLEDGRTTAWVALALLITSPWFWAMGASYMSHGPASLFFAGFLAGLAGARRGSTVSAFLCGLFLGGAAATRSADALLLSAPFGLLWLADVLRPENRERWIRRSAALALGVCPGLVILLGNNLLAHGGPLVFGYDLFHQGSYRFSLGDVPLRMQMDPLSFKVHTLSRGLSNLRGLLTDLQIVLFGLGIPSLVLPLLAGLRGVRDRLGVAGLCALALYLGAYTFVPEDLTMFGPRYAYVGMPLFVWLGARGLLQLHRRAAALGLGRFVPVLVALGVILAVGHAIPAGLGSFDPAFSGVDRDLERALEREGANRATVLVAFDPRGLRGNPFLYTSAFRLADPDLRKIAPVLMRDKPSIDAAMRAFPNRPAYLWLPLYEGPFYRLRLLTAQLIRVREASDQGYVAEREKLLRTTAEVYRIALARGTGDAVVWNSLGVLARLDANTAAARSYFTKATRLNPKDPAAWINLALVELAQGRVAQARQAATEARQLAAPLPPPLAALFADSP